MGYFDDPLGGTNPWIDRGPTYIRDVEVVEDTSKIRAWQDHAEKLQAAFRVAVRDRDVFGLQRNAWKETCKEVRDRLDPNFTNEEILEIYDRKEKIIFREKNVPLPPI